MIPVNEITISQEAKDNVNQALDTGWISSAGNFVTRFEKKFAAYLGMKHAITVTSGTAALHVALLALGVGPDDEVIVPAFTMGSTWMAVLYVGAKPVFVDCLPDTYNINPDLIAAKITKHTKAIIPVHIYGHAVDLDPVLKIAKKYHLKVIEDAAEALGGEYKGKKCGSFGDVNCFSFYGNKIVTTGEGGMLVTNSDRLANSARKFRDMYHSDRQRFVHDKIGFNYRFSNLQAAVGCGELKHINTYLAKKKSMADSYTRQLRKIPGIIIPITKDYSNNTYWIYAIQIDKNIFGIDKDTFRAKLKQKGIDTRNFFYPPTVQPVLKPYLSNTDKFPVSTTISQSGCYIPSGLAITDLQINRVISVIKSLYAGK